jgi:hypothetical protein
MSKPGQRFLGVLVAVAGLALFLVSVFADEVGLGVSPGFGYRQILGSAVGLLIAAAGIVLRSKVPPAS